MNSPISKCSEPHHDHEAEDHRFSMEWHLLHFNAEILMRISCCVTEFADEYMTSALPGFLNERRIRFERCVVK